MNFGTHRLTLQSQNCNDHNYEKIAKWAKHMDVHVKSFIFKPLDPTSILAFLHNSKTTCHSGKIHAGTAMWLFLTSWRRWPRPRYHIKWVPQRTITIARNRHWQPAVKMSAIYWKPLQLMISLEKPKLTSWTTSSQNMSAIRYLATLWEKHQGVEESTISQDLKACSKKDNTTYLASLWEITGVLIKVPHYGTWRAMLHHFLNWRNAPALAAYLAGLKTAVGKGRRETIIGNNDKPL